MKILAAAFAALAISITTAAAASAEEEEEEEESDFRNFYCEFLDSYNPEQFEAYPPCNW